MSTRTEDGFAEQLAVAARSLRIDANDVSDTLEKAVHLATEIITACDEAGLSIVHSRKRIDTPAATSETVRRGDALQYELGEGPCLDAIWDHEIVVSGDLGNDGRWPTWGPRVADELGVHSMLALQLFTVNGALGAMNLYSRQRNAFDKECEVEGLALAAHVAVALAAAQEIEHLNSAIINRTVIGQAEGILMERFDIDADQAFAVLQRVSSTSNRKLAKVAGELVRTRQTPGVG